MTDPLSQRIAVLGTGRVGTTIASKLYSLGCNVTFGSRSANSAAERLSRQLRQLPITSYAAAVQHADMVIFCVPWTFAEDTIRSVLDWRNKILVDCTNPLNDKFDALTVGFDSSAAEWIAAWAVGSHVVKSLNTVSAALMADPIVNGQATAMLYCGDSAIAKLNVAQLLKIIGFDPIDCGPLVSARYLEPLAMLYINMAMRQGYRGRWGFKLIRESEEERERYGQE